jgi:hypothetical protein
MVIVTFFIYDPFCIIHSEDTIAEQSSDVLQFREFNKCNADKNFDTFIFGNSRGNSFSESYLKSRIGGNPSIFFFNAPGDCILNYYKKILHIKKSGNKIRHAIVLIDQGILANKDNLSNKFHGPVYEHTVHSSNRSYFNFYSAFLNYYFTDLFFLKFLQYQFTGEYTPWMSTAFKKPETSTQHYENKLRKDSLLENHFEEYKSTYNPIYERTYKWEEIIGAMDYSDVCYLRQIREIFDKDSTHYIILIPPDFHQQKVPGQIMAQLTEIFDSSRIIDFTGVNEITRDSSLNYENLHFSIKAGNIILDSIYHGQNY